MRIIAHRGFSAGFAENTTQSWDAALAAGAFAIETDIRFSSDGVGVCAHDADLARLFQRPEQVSALPYAELAKLENADGARIALLSDVLSYVRDGNRVLLDLKEETPQALDRLWQTISAEVPATLRPLLIAGCHSLEAVRYFCAQGETSILGFIPSPEQAEAFWHAGARSIRLWENDASPALVKRLRSLGAEVWVTSGGHGTGLAGGDHTGTDIAQLAQSGVSGLLVNDVAMATRRAEALA